MAGLPDGAEHWIITIVTAIMSFLAGSGRWWYNAISKDKKLAKKEDIENARRDLEDIVRELREDLAERDRKIEQLNSEVLRLSTVCAGLEARNEFLSNEITRMQNGS